MKKLYAFIAVALFSATISAYGQQVILRFSKNYEVNIDGRYYEYNERVPTLNYGQHTAKLYEVEPGFLGLGKRRVLAHTANFELRNNDVIIEVDQNRKLRITQVGNKNTRNQQDSRTYDGTSDRNRDNDNQRNGRGYGPYNNPGRGHKYGHYKNGKNKSHDRDDDRDDDRYRKDKHDKNKKDKKYKNEHDRWHAENDNRNKRNN
jgi:hypothetical protein